MVKLKTKKALVALLAAVVMAGLVLFLRGPHVSNVLKKLVLPEMQSALGHQVMARKIYVNLLPFYISAEGVKVLDDDGQRLLTVDSVKAYVALSSIFKRRITVDTIVIKSPVLGVSKARADEIMGKARMKAKGGDGRVRFDLGTVVVMDGKVRFDDDEAKTRLTASGIDAEVVLGQRPDVTFSAEGVGLDREGWPALEGSISTNFILGEGSIDFRRLNVNSAGSSLSGTGNYSPSERTGSFRLDIDARVDTVKKLFKLKESGYGSIRARGRLDLVDGFRDPRVDFDVRGDFKLETLLELVRAKLKHRLTGLISFDGEIGGRMSDLRGTADARITNALLYGIKLDDAKCRVEYSDNVLALKDGRGRLYGGTGDINVSFPLPKAKPYTVDVEFRDIDNTEAFKLIGMDWLDVPDGKVRGRLYTSGRKFRPEGWAVYEAAGFSDDPLGRVKTIKGSYRMQDGVVYLTGMEARSDASDLLFQGRVDTVGKSIDFTGRLTTRDVKDLSTPYFGRLSGTGGFEGTVTGPTRDPLLRGRLWMNNVFLDDYPLGDVEAVASYRKNLFSVVEAVARHEGSEYRGKGTVEFPKAEALLQLGDPVYDMSISLAGADLAGILGVHNLDIPLEGTADADIEITGGGPAPVYSGVAKVRDAALYGFPVDDAGLRFSYDFEKFSVMDAVLRTGGSSLSLDGSIDKQGAFEFAAASKEFYLDDAVSLEFPVNYRMALEARGRGTVQEPEIAVDAVLSGGSFKGRPFGGGSLRARLTRRALTYEAELLDNKLSLRGEASLLEPYRWSADVDIRPGRYDFLVSAYLKEVPEDMLFNVVGKARLRGTRDRIEASATLEQANLTMYGQSFTNRSDIVFTVDGNRVTFKNFELRSGNASLNVRGDFALDENYNITLDGSSSLAPLAALSDKLSVLRGQVKFVVALQGDWYDPVINGGLVVSDASLGLKGIPQRLASIDGYSYFDDDTIVIQNLDAKLGGGDVSVSGFVRLDRMRPVRANLDMLLNGVGLTLSKGFRANVGGNVIFKASPDRKVVTGEVVINRADYTDPLEWRSWLLKAKQAEAAMPKSGLLDNVNLSVRLYGSENIKVDNNVARANLKIDTVLRGTVVAPVLFGRIEAEEGSVYFRNSEFRIVRATADFSDTEKTDPYVDIVAETSVKGYHVWLALEGKLHQLDMTLLSDPELEDVEILALLTVGEFGERLQGLEGGIGAAEATSVITGGFQGIVEERLRDLTGITRFTIDPHVSRKTGTITPRVTVSKRLMGERLFVTYSSSMSTSEEQEVKLEYSITRNVSLLGGQDDRGSLGGDIRFRVRFK